MTTDTGINTKMTLLDAPALWPPTNRNQPVRVGARTLRYFAEESRITVQIVSLLRFATVFALASGPLPSLGGGVAGGLALVLAASAVYVFNGVTDRVEDRANGSTRPIVSDRLPVRTAVRGIVAATVLALLISGFSGGPVLLAPLVGYLACGYAYSGAPFHGKRRGHTASLLVLGLGAFTYVVGWAGSGHRHALAAIVLAVAMSAWMAGVGTLVKDFSDVEGDALAGRRTPQIVWRRSGARLLASANALAVGAGYLTAALAWAPLLVPSALVVSAGAVVVAVLTRTTRNSAGRDRLRLPYRAFMVTQYGAHAVLLAWLIVR